MLVSKMYKLKKTYSIHDKMIVLILTMTGKSATFDSRNFGMLKMKEAITTGSRHFRSRVRIACSSFIAWL